ncbi:hypothetical protein ACIBL8_28360 [Streptomyces sp. NPDC050523]|uniref:hypothetical protein n=1 Tax=Streptomyces sp. NPDC050523 TaxID=3365622 RepID=UPI0037AC5B70
MKQVTDPNDPNRPIRTPRRNPLGGPRQPTDNQAGTHQPDQNRPTANDPGQDDRIDLSGPWVRREAHTAINNLLDKEAAGQLHPEAAQKAIKNLLDKETAGQPHREAAQKGINRRPAKEAAGQPHPEAAQEETNRRPAKEADEQLRAEAARFAMATMGIDPVSRLNRAARIAALPKIDTKLAQSASSTSLHQQQRTQAPQEQQDFQGRRLREQRNSDAAKKKHGRQ